MIDLIRLGLVAALAVPGLAAQDRGAAEDAAYLTHARLSAEIRRVARDHRRVCDVEVIGTSREGREIHALRVARPGDVDPAERPAILVAANLDGAHVHGSAVALQVVENLLARDADDDGFLERGTLYVVPRVNPDAAERFFGDDPRREWHRNLRPDDADRDGRTDEDPPDDVDGDGLITMMRVLDPEKADRMPDPEAPRLNVEPDRDKGERAVFHVLVEGIDDDGDGEYNEDDVGGVDLDMNFMHGYREHADGAGPHPISEPETRALIDFVLAHQNIAIVLVYGPHDTLSRPPDGKGAFPSGAPKTIDEKDAGLYAEIGRRFVEATGLKKVEAAEPAGAFHAWAYAQFGVPAFSTPLWTRPEPEKKKDGDGAKDGGAGEKEDAKEAGDEGLTPSAYGDIAQETIDELRTAAEDAGVEVTDEMMEQLTPAMIEHFAQEHGVPVRRVGKKPEKAGERGKPKDAEAAAWLAYSDDVRDGAGFVPWRPFEHPQLGAVEIGGWMPYFRTVPPPEAVAEIADAQTAFVLELGSLLPVVSVTEPEVTRLAAGLYEIKLALVNDGYLPTGTAMAVRNRRARPHVVRIDTPLEDIVAGQRVQRVWSIPGSGGREAFRWIVRADEGDEVTLTVYSAKYGTLERSIVLGGEGGAE